MNTTSFNDSKIEAAIKFLLSQHSRDQAKRADEVTSTVIGYNLGRKVKGSKAVKAVVETAPESVKADKPSTSTSAVLPSPSSVVETVQEASQASDTNRNPLPPPVSDPLPQAGTLTAREFIVAMRSNNRQEQIKAIAGFVGFDSRQLFGAQETMARMQANRVLSGQKLVIRTPTETHNAYRSVQGYCTGMPDHSAKRLADLKAKEVEAIESIVQYESVGNVIMAEEHRVTLSQIRALIDLV
jgi:hypothetical protein